MKPEGSRMMPDIYGSGSRGPDHLHDIKTDPIRSGGEGGGVFYSRPIQVPLLFASHRILCRTQTLSRTGFYFNYHQQRALSGEKIQFIVFSHPHPSSEKFQRGVFTEIRFRMLLPPFSQCEVRCLFLEPKNAECA